MALFNFGKKREEKKTPAYCCGSEAKVEETTSCCCSAPRAESATICCCGKHMDGICCVKVLGAGCKSCHELYEATKEAVKGLDLSLEVEYITDMEKIMEYGVMRMPALVVNEKVVSVGKVLKAAEVEKLLKG